MMLKKVCYYCKKPIEEGDFYVVDVLYDVYNRKHKKYFHSVNGGNFLDSCYMRYVATVPHGYRVELKVPTDEGWYGTYSFRFVKEND